LRESKNFEAARQYSKVDHPVDAPGFDSGSGEALMRSVASVHVAQNSVDRPVWQEASVQQSQHSQVQRSKHQLSPRQLANSPHHSHKVPSIRASQNARSSLKKSGLLPQQVGRQMDSSLERSRQAPGGSLGGRAALEEQQSFNRLSKTILTGSSRLQ